MRLEITRALIDRADRNRDGHDPVSLALRPYLAEGWESDVNTRFLHIRTTKPIRPPGRYVSRHELITLALPRHVNLLVRDWQSGRDIQPFHFDHPDLDKGPWRKRNA